MQHTIHGEFIQWRREKEGMCKSIGILGGMGPSATIDLFQKIVANTPAQTDQEHLRIIIYNNPKIPPRSYALHPSSTNPLPELINSAKTLERAGVDFIIMPCHTAHIWFNEIRDSIQIPFYNMIEATLYSMLEQFHDQEQILLLATETTNHVQLYQNAFKNSPFNILKLNSKEQRIMDQAIKYVKAGQITDHPFDELNRILRKYENKGIHLLLGGCTEIPLMFPHFKIHMELIDPTLILAKLAVLKAVH